MLKSKPEVILQRLDWSVIRRLDGILQGNYRTLFYGQGLDLADIREYQFGDDVRAIDWNVTARMNTPYIRQFQEDREVTAWFLLDCSPSVDFGTVHALKRDMLVDFTTTMARLLTRRGNRVGAVLFDGQNHYVIPAASGKLHVLRLVNDLLRLPHLPRSPMTSLGPLLEAAYRAIPRRSLVFVVSDFFSAPGWEGPLSLMARRHEVLCVRLSDPRETDLPDIGLVVMEDAETGEQVYIDTHNRGFRERFRQAAKRRDHDLKVVFRRTGIDVLSLATDDDLVKSLVRFATLRKQRKQTPASGTLRK